jgi:hypothetical protein
MRFNINFLVNSGKTKSIQSKTDLCKGRSQINDPKSDHKLGLCRLFLYRQVTYWGLSWGVASQ